MTIKRRLAIVVTHPIQHFVSFYRGLAARDDIELMVFFGAPIGIKPYFDTEMQTQISWKMDMLGGYDSVFLSPEQGEADPGPRAPNSKNVQAALSAFDPDAVIIYGYAQVNALRALWWCRTNAVPAMMIGDSELLQERADGKKFLKRLLVPLVLKQFSGFLSVGDRNEDYYRHFGIRDDAIFRVPFTIDEPAFRAARDTRRDARKSIRAAFGIAESSLLGLFVGKLSTRKRPHDILDALAYLKARQDADGIEFLFVGNGEAVAELQAQASAQDLPVHFAGFVNVDRLPAFYAAADVLVHPSAADPHPLICSEAACVGLPMILSDRIGAVGPTDIAREGRNALIFPVGHAPDIAEHLLFLRNSPERLAAMSKTSCAIYDDQNLATSIRGVVAALDAKA